MPALPTDWQDTTMATITEFKKAGELYGVGLPVAWRGELADYHRNGELRTLLGVKRVGFVKGDKVVVLTDEATPKETKGKPRR